MAVAAGQPGHAGGPDSNQAAGVAANPAARQNTKAPVVAATGGALRVSMLPTP
jgi:hypothetical protein